MSECIERYEQCVMRIFKLFGGKDPLTEEQNAYSPIERLEALLNQNLIGPLTHISVDIPQFETPSLNPILPQKDTVSFNLTLKASKRIERWFIPINMVREVLRDKLQFERLKLLQGIADDVSAKLMVTSSHIEKLAEE